MKLRELITKAPTLRCEDQDLPVLSATKQGLVFQSEKYKKDIASNDKSQYWIVKPLQLVSTFHMDQGIIPVWFGNIPGIVSPAYKVWNIDTNKVHPKYLELLLKSPNSIAHYLKHAKTTVAGRCAVNDNDFLDLEIRLPSLSKQQHILDILDKMEYCIQCATHRLELLDELVKSRFIELFGDYRINEKGFDCKKGSELFKFSSGKFLPEEKRLDEGIPVYGGNGIAWYTSESLVDYPTIIIGRVGAQCGNIHAVTTPVWITDNAIYIKEQKTNVYTLEFLTELMRMMDFYQYADFSGQPKITQKPLETLNYIMPPIELQNEYTAFVEQTDKSKLATTETLKYLEELKAALMSQYFG